MAGISDGIFCRNLAPEGFDMVTIGGYNVDRETIAAGRRIIKRGRSEFDIPLVNILSYINEQTQIIKSNNPWKGMVSVNIRSTTPAPIIEISKLQGIDVVEINAHCRQPEIMDLGCGQSLLNQADKLYNFTREVVENADSKVSVKIRANVPGVNTIGISKTIDDAGADYLHVDAMKPGYPHADYNIINSIKAQTEIFLIGNNSIKDIESGKKMIKSGADGISMARALINGNMPFDLSLL